MQNKIIFIQWVREIKGWMSEMPIEQTVGVDENEALREKIGDITLDSDQVWKNSKNLINCGITFNYTTNLIFKRFDFT